MANRGSRKGSTRQRFRISYRELSLSKGNEEGRDRKRRERERSGPQSLLGARFSAVMSKANSWMNDAWERVVEAAVDGQATRSSELRVLNLDGSVKSLHGCLPPAGILERFPSLEHLSIANVGVLSLEKFPRLRKLQRLVLSDNRIAGGLENLVQAGLHSLRDLDLSNNRIQYIEDLAPLAKLHLVSLDLYECPVTRVNDYRSKVFSMIGTLKYLDKLDANEDERPETDDDDDEEEEEDYEYDDFDPGSGEIDGDDRAGKLVNGCGDFADVDDVIVDADEDEESDADEEEMETSGRGSVNGVSRGSGHHLSNGFRVAAVGVVSVDGNENDADEDVEVEDDEDDLGEEIDEEGDDTDLAHKVFGSDEDDEDDEDGVDDVEDNEVDVDEEDDDDEEDLEDDDGVDIDEYEVGVEDEEDTEPGSLARFEEEIDGHEHGEEDENEEIDWHDENGEIGGEDELVIEDRDSGEDFDDGEDEDDLGGDYLVQPIARPIGRSSQSDFNVESEEDDLEPVDDSQQDNIKQPALYSSNKRRRDDEGDLDDGDNLEELRLSKRH